MISRVKNLIQENRLRQKQILTEIQLNRKEIQETAWAEIFHDSIKGKSFLQDLPLNIGRWAGNYSFFYILNRVLMDYKPQSILEFGLGESSKFISVYLDNYLFDTKHLIIEQDENWKLAFNEKYKLSERSKVLIFPLQQLDVKGYKSNVYKDLAETVKEKFDLYVIDGPFGSDRYSRYDLVNQVKSFDQTDQFIIIIDDYNRQGEKDTMEIVIEELKAKDINHFTKCYEGKKSQLLIASEKYRYATTL